MSFDHHCEEPTAEQPKMGNAQLGIAGKFFRKNRKSAMVVFPRPTWSYVLDRSPNPHLRTERAANADAPAARFSIFLRVSL